MSTSLPQIPPLPLSPPSGRFDTGFRPTSLPEQSQTSKKTPIHRRFRVLARATLAVITLTLLTNCVSAYIESVGGKQDHVYVRIYVTEFNTAWQAALDSLKHTRLDITNREGGFIQSRWTENTAEKNLTDSFGNADSYLKAQYRFRVNVAKGFYNGIATVKVSVQKEQLVQRDVLEGWRTIESDSIDETTLLYRIGRLIYIRTRLAQIEDQKSRKAIEAAEQMQF